MPPLGIQPIVFQKTVSLEEKAESIFDAIRAAGFAAVEYNLKDPVRLRETLAARALKHAGVHVSAASLRDPQHWIEYLKVTGGRDVCNSGMLDWGKRGRAEFTETIHILNTAGRALRAHGIHLHYHNHDFEFLERPDGKTRGIDILAAELDPAACDLCMDVGWIVRGGDDPARFLTRYADRIGYLHLKDTDGKKWVELGRGVVDWPTVISVVKSLPRVRWAMYEQDSTEINPAESTAVSRRFLLENFGY